MTEKPPLEALRLLNGFQAYRLVVAACMLKLPDLVAAGHGEPATLAALTGTHEPSMRRMLRGLEVWGFFVKDSHDRYASTPVSEWFRSDRPGLRDMALMLSKEGYTAWGDLLYALQTGKPVFEHRFGKGRWEQMAEDPQDAALFNAAMVETTRRVGAAFVAALNSPACSTWSTSPAETGLCSLRCWLICRRPRACCSTCRRGSPARPSGSRRRALRVG